jgi:hypothetical protein
MKRLLLFCFILLLFFSPLVFGATCGNGVCESGETKESCSKDCEACPVSQRVIGEDCKEYYKAPDGTCQTRYFALCCGNERCEAGESYANCAQDCKPQSVTIEVLGFDYDRNYMRGDSVLVKVRVRADGKLAGGANVAVVGFFGSMKLFDDGEHGDNKAADAIYANRFTIGADAVEGRKVLKITADKLGTVGTTSVTMQLNPSLGLSMELNEGQFALGDTIDVAGRLTRRGVPLEKEITISFIVGESVFVSSPVLSDANGFFSYSYHTSLIDPPGDWDVVASAADEYGNEGLVSKGIEVYKGIEGSYYTVDFVEPVSKIFNRGEVVKFLVELKDSDGNFVEGATATIALPNALPIKLNEISPGSYSYSYEIPYDFSLGKQEVTVVASKDVNGFLLSGFASKELIIDKGKIFVEMRRPTNRIFTVGDTMHFEFKLYYVNNESVSDPLIDLRVDNRQLQVEELRRGIYSAAYIISEEAPAKKILLSLSVVDKSGNEGSYSEEFEVRASAGIIHIIQRDLFLSALATAGMLFALGGAIFYLRRASKTRGLVKRRNELKKLMKELKKQYYERGRIRLQDYRGLLNRYQQELDEIDAVLGAGGKK